MFFQVFSSFSGFLGTYCPYKKPGKTLLYINKNSNHPPSIIKNLPNNIVKRVSDLSSNSEQFNKAKNPYQKALRESGYQASFNFEKTNTGNNSVGIANCKSKNRKRNITWFNPPFSANVSTNVGKKFLTLIDKHFPVHHKYRKLFNRNNLKVSYSCMSNMESIIKKHNTKILNKKTQTTDKKCNCRIKENCPLGGECLKKDIVYKATVKTDNNLKIYFGLTEREFKTRFNNHKMSFKNNDYAKSTELSKYIWNLKDRDEHFEIKWNIAAQAKSFRPGARRCNLCLMEKLLISEGKRRHLLNKRSELVAMCRHKNKFFLKSIK